MPRGQLTSLNQSPHPKQIDRIGSRRCENARRENSKGAPDNEAGVIDLLSFYLEEENKAAQNEKYSYREDRLIENAQPLEAEKPRLRRRGVVQVSRYDNKRSGATNRIKKR
ncbi:hypothetical protein ACVWW6_004261 [Bradyrhizobium sp. USDA 3311]|nr:hypothetical protein [Bradyrhizobium sp. CCBAU 45394]